MSIKAGFPWFGCWGRDTFISLPGLLLVDGGTKEFSQAIRSMLPDLKQGLFPNTGRGKNAVYNSVDSALWFIWAIQQYAAFTGRHKKVWQEFGRYCIEILDNYSRGTLFNIKMDSDYLIVAGQTGCALTWMDAVIDGTPVTPRMGKAVEINALWYNAVRFCIEIAELAGDGEFVEKWGGYPEQIRRSFMATFSGAEKKYLADCSLDGVTDWSVRPNQVFALSLPYSPVTGHLKNSILETLKEELLTPKGLRTLSAKDEKYKGLCEGDQETRDLAYHQGTVWPWLLGHYAQAHVNVYGTEALGTVSEVWGYFKEMMGDACLHTIPEIYNGDYPHKSVGAVAQAWSVGEARRVQHMLQQITKE